MRRAWRQPWLLRGLLCKRFTSNAFKKEAVSPARQSDQLDAVKRSLESPKLSGAQQHGRFLGINHGITYVPRPVMELPNGFLEES